MSDPTGRTLRLLSLLQRRRHWSGPELAARVGVSDRTLRRDVDRLRTLGYRVDSEPGVEGGYRLRGSTDATALLLDDDEAIALAAALHAAASGASDLAEASLGALTKVLSMLDPAQRGRAEAVRAVTAFGPAGDTVAPDLSVLGAIASACRDRVRLSFRYVDAEGRPTERYVEPFHLVAVDRRWYLVAHDVDRDDWRTFRVDRISAPNATRNSVPPRAAPAEDLYAYVRFQSQGTRATHRVVIEIDAPGDEVRAEYGRWVEVADVGARRCRVTMVADSFRWPTHIVSEADAPVRVIEPPEFAEHLRRLARRMGQAGGAEASTTSNSSTAEPLATGGGASPP